VNKNKGNKIKNTMATKIVAQEEFGQKKYGLKLAQAMQET
jgi:hypothetical protein